MTYLKKIIFAATLAVASLGFSLSSNAALITHDILFNSDFDAVDEFEKVGEITVHLFENGATGPQDIFEFVSFTFLGEDVTEVLSAPGFPGFIAVVDRDDVFTGIEFLFFDVNIGTLDIGLVGIYDLFDDPNFNEMLVLDIFDPNLPLELDFGLLTLSSARVVSEPSVLALFALALVGFGIRRKAK